MNAIKHQILIYITTVLTCTCGWQQVKAQVTEINTETITLNVVPKEGNCIFNKNNEARYKVIVKNSSSTKQEGTVSYVLKTATGIEVSNASFDVSIKSKSTKKIKFTLDVPEAGFYNLYVRVNVDEYDDTIRSVFGYRPFDINTEQHLPEDFDEFWNKAKADLAAVPPNYTLTLDKELSKTTHDVYKVEMQSLNNVPIVGWFTIPKVPGTYPILYGFGGYHVKLSPTLYDDFAAFSINVRGNGEYINKLINPKGTELFLLNIEDKNNYTYRGGYMDCLRGLQFILDNATKLRVDTNKIAFYGGSLGGTMALVTEALSNKGVFCAVDNPAYCDFSTNYDIIEKMPEPTIPIKFILKYLHSNPSVNKDKIISNLHYFETQNFTPKIHCPILMGMGLQDLLAPPTCGFSAFNKMPQNVKNASEVYVFPKLGHEVTSIHNSYKGTWFYEKMAAKSKK